jgi:DNA mismatch repair protein MutS2
MTSKSLEVLDYNTLKHILSSFTQFPGGLQRVQDLLPLDSGAEVVTELEIAAECIRLFDQGLSLDFSELIDYSEIFEKLSVPGLALEPREILQVVAFGLCAHSTKKSLDSLGREALRVVGLGRRIPEFEGLLRSLQGKISAAGEVEDHASPLLKRLRNEINILRKRLYEALGKILQRHSSTQAIQDEVITIRNERFVIPVRVESRKEFSGVVHGTSSSGSTLFLEPLETLELNNRLVRLKEQAEEETRNILRVLTERTREFLTELRSAVQILGYLDLGFAKGRFAKKYRCVIPEINENGLLSIVDGRHPILEANLKAQQKEIVPISVDLDAARQILVISGPNTGGKTVALKTVGLLTLMALSGLPVPAASANICVIDDVYTDIGDRQSIAENLSTFSSHLLNIRDILETVSAPALVLLDELGTGTDPAEGSALGVAIVECLRQKGIMAVVTTHHNGLKMYASTTPRVTNASVEFDEASLRPTFRLIHGVPGNSSGIEVARRLGLAETIVEHARQLVSSEQQQVALFSRHLREQLDENAKLRDQFRGELKALELERTALEERFSRLEARKQQEWEQLRQSAVASFEGESRKLLGEIRDKFLSVRARREIEKKNAKLREEFHRDLSALSGPASLEAVPAPKAEPLDSRSPVFVGSRVKVKRFGQDGTVVAAHSNNQWEVVVGNFKCLLDSREIEPIGSEAPLHERPRKSAVMVQLNSPELQSNEINVVGCTVDEAINRVDKFLDSAFLASISQVRLIHGTGMGVLRKALSEWLSQQPYVEKFFAADANQGGNGVTIVSLKAE